MTEIVNKSNGKIEFGYDYLVIMRNLEFRGFTDGMSDYFPITDAVARLFLLQWGFTLEEIDEANRFYIDKSDKGLLPDDLNPVINRLVEFLQKDQSAVEKFIIVLAAIGDMDGKITDAEKSFVTQFQTLFDMKPSEFYALCRRGVDWSCALNFLGDAFIERSKKIAR